LVVSFSFSFPLGIYTFLAFTLHFYYFGWMNVLSTSFLLLLPSRRSPNHTSPPPNPPIIYPTSHNLKNNPCFPGRIGSLFPFFHQSIPGFALVPLFLPFRLGSSLLHLFILFKYFFQLGFFFVHTITLLPPLPFFLLFHSSIIFVALISTACALAHFGFFPISFFLWFGLVRKYGFMGGRIVVGYGRIIICNLSMNLNLNFSSFSGCLCTFFFSPFSGLIIVCR